MSNRIYDGFENGRHVVLRLIDTAHRLSGAHSLVSRDEPASLGDLAVEWSRDVHCINLIPLGIEGTGHVTLPICHGLDVGMRHPTFRLIRTHQNTGDRRVPLVVSRSREHSQLVRKCLEIIVGSANAKTLDALRLKFFKQRSMNRLLVKTDQSRLAALLMQPHKIVRLHAPFRASDSMEISTGTLMDEQARLNLDSKHGTVLAARIRQLKPFNHRMKRRFDRVPYNPGYELFNRVEPDYRNPENLVCTVVDPEHEHAPSAVCKRGKLVRK